MLAITPIQGINCIDLLVSYIPLNLFNFSLTLFRAIS